mmetsp:Transcript_34275/g.70085  ORF Transcript_34275/g.70085 Transcript_34275/m.70085 type:complete len:115 (-) Transcript_34275:129-473(-)
MPPKTMVTAGSLVTANVVVVTEAALVLVLLTPAIVIVLLTVVVTVLVTVLLTVLLTVLVLVGAYDASRDGRVASSSSWATCASQQGTSRGLQPTASSTPVELGASCKGLPKTSL